LWFDRSVTPAWGLLGGESGVGPDVVITTPDNQQMHILKTNRKPIPNHSVIKTHTGGGGGFGRAVEREPALVREDVLDGYVTIEAAKHQYGVVLREDLTVDADATDALRKTMN
jgi:N-methylhydantoinase B